MRYFTADWHLASENILKYARRPFKNAIKAELEILAGAENTVRFEEGLLFHVGDFMLAGTDRHGAAEDVAAFDVNVGFIRRSLGQLGVGLVLMKGNHDDGRNGETDVDGMVVDLSQAYRRIRVAHYPTTRGDYRFALCGHVHDAWLVREFNGTVNVNVGVDVWDYRPVSAARLVRLMSDVDYIRGSGIAGGAFPTCRTLADVESLKLKAEAAYAAARAGRKAERYARKGLTPEECARRKAEAMKKKGITK